MVDPTAFNREALNAACYRTARETMWRREPIDVAHLESVSESFLKRAEESVDFVIDAARDPNIITRCVEYLARTHAIPPMRDDTSWFGEMLDCLLELAVPNCEGSAESEGFYRDIEDGLAASRAD